MIDLKSQQIFKETELVTGSYFLNMDKLAESFIQKLPDAEESLKNILVNARGFALKNKARIKFNPSVINDVEVKFSERNYKTLDEVGSITKESNSDLFLMILDTKIDYNSVKIFHEM